MATYRQAYLVDFDIRVRVIADIPEELIGKEDDLEFDEIMCTLALEKLKDNINRGEYDWSGIVSNIEEDSEVPYDPKEDN